MGRTILKAAACKLLKSWSGDDEDDGEVTVVRGESEMDYLCNIPPHR